MQQRSGIDASRLDAGQRASVATFGVGPKGLSRIVDVALALPLLVFVSPLLVAIYALIRISDQGPAMLRQMYVGRDGRQFAVLKFRTLHVDADERLAQLLETDAAAREDWRRFRQLRNDPRVTSVGRILRKSRLDELPQLINILRGDMSLIGARPIITRGK